jgi:hypothetical protein
MPENRQGQPGPRIPTLLPAPGDAEYTKAFRLVRHVQRRHRAGRPARIALPDVDAAVGLVAALADIAAVACHVHDHDHPDCGALLDLIEVAS